MGPIIDIVLLLSVLAAVFALETKDLVVSVVFLAVFSLLCALVYFLLHAPDVALTEAAWVPDFRPSYSSGSSGVPEEGRLPVKKTDILDVTARKLSPFIMLFGFYVVTHGHLSPGGGFQGGVVLASGLMLLLLCNGPEEIEKLFPSRRLAGLESLGFVFFLAAGAAGIAVSGYFLGPPGFSDEGFILALNIIIGVKVGAGISLMCYKLFRESPSP
jgi:multicomponent Na+:H+ antiporter subunit B